MEVPLLQPYIVAYCCSNYNSLVLDRMKWNLLIVNDGVDDDDGDDWWWCWCCCCCCWCCPIVRCPVKGSDRIGMCRLKDGVVVVVVELKMVLKRRLVAMMLDRLWQTDHGWDCVTRISREFAMWLRLTNVAYLFVWSELFYTELSNNEPFKDILSP